MKSNFYKVNPKKILGYLMAFCMVLCTYTVKAQCIPNGNVCMCPMIYNPVCGCDGVLYNNDCLANCQGVAYTPAVPNGSGGFLPCATPVNCTVGVTATATNATSATANDGTATATLVGPTTCATTFLWSNGATTAVINNLSPGSYTVVTTDCQGCTDSATVIVSAVPAVSHCCNVSQYGSGVAPTAGTNTISTCNYLTEYSPISAVVSGSTYTIDISGPNASPGWIVVYEGSSCGNFVAEGTAPLTFTASTNGTHYVHWLVDSNCTTLTGCHTTTIMYGAPVWGCTNSLATNYNPLANQDDGSCIFSGCTSGIGANSESFEDPAVSLYGQGPWADWTYDAATSTFTSTNGWRKDNLGTGSTGTGPLNGAPSLDGDYYLYCETSGGGIGAVANLVSSCVDLNNFTDAAFVFGYSMYGATMGVLNVDVSNDGGTTWTTLWTKSGDQGQPWQEGVISLQNSYAGQIVQVRMSYTSGSSFTGDCAIDFLRFMESPNAGCMDPFAANYDPTATMDDGSCLYPGCMDPMAINFCASCNVNDSLSCVYPSSNTLPFCDDFESASLSTNGWTAQSGTAAGTSVQLTSVNAIADTVSIEMTGADALAGWTGVPTTEATAFANTSHVSAANILLDLSASTGPINLAFDYKTESFYSSGTIFGGSVYSTMRVKVNGVVVQDINGDSWHGSEDLTSLRYNLSSYAGQSSVTVTFESACRYGPGYSVGTYGDFVWIDNVCAFDVTPCSYYDVSSTSTDVTCHGGSDGSVSASVSGMDTSFIYNNSYSWTDASASVVGTSSTVSGLAAGTYTCVVSDAINGCSASSSVVVGGPATAVTISAIIVPSSTPMSNNGSVDVTVSGGTPCATSIQVGSGTVSSYLHRLWYTFYMDGRSELTYLDTELAALGMNPGDIIDEFGWKILSQTGSAATWPMNGANLSFNGTNVWNGTHQAVVGLNNFVLTTP
ncbi:MAG: hypothetical protein HOJ12_00745, partial [Flavobacteriales bacterium]|nr:hypothetical protein [Flavobacteriales bacterium]